MYFCRPYSFAISSLTAADNVAAVGDDGMDRQIQFVGNRLVGHAFYDAGNDFLFTLAERFLFAVLLIFFFGMEKTVDFCGNHFDIVTDTFSRRPHHLCHCEQAGRTERY